MLSLCLSAWLMAVSCCRLLPVFPNLYLSFSVASIMFSPLLTYKMCTKLVPVSRELLVSSLSLLFTLLPWLFLSHLSTSLQSVLLSLLLFFRSLKLPSSSSSAAASGFWISLQSDTYSKNTSERPFALLTHIHTHVHTYVHTTARFTIIMQYVIFCFSLSWRRTSLSLSPAREKQLSIQ